MPNLNQRGPMGEGPMTGRKIGRCTNMGARRRNQIIEENENVESSMNDDYRGQGFGRGRGRGRGMGRGLRNAMSFNRGGGRGMGRNRGGGGRGMGIGRRFRDDIEG